MTVRDFNPRLGVGNPLALSGHPSKQEYLDFMRVMEGRRLALRGRIGARMMLTGNCYVTLHGSVHKPKQAVPIPQFCDQASLAELQTLWEAL